LDNHSTVDGVRSYTLAPEWSSDGGHLNSIGRRRMGERLFVQLASLPGFATAE
jgi:hypothetical protein